MIRPICHGKIARAAAFDGKHGLSFKYRWNDSFDIVSSTLFVHHLMPRDVGQFMSEGLRVCRTAVLINDVVRSPWHLALVYAGLPLFRSRLTWHDAPASVRQAYTLKEIEELLAQAGAARVDIGWHYLFRMGVIAWKH